MPLMVATAVVGSSRWRHEGRKRSPLVQIGRAGYRMSEPQNLAIPAEKPRGLRQMLELLYGVPIDYRRLAADSRLTPTFLRQIIDVHAEKPKPTAGRKPILQLRRGGRN